MFSTWLQMGKNIFKNHLWGHHQVHPNKHSVQLIFYGSLFYFQVPCNVVNLFFSFVYLFCLSDLLGDSGEEAEPW